MFSLSACTATDSSKVFIPETAEHNLAIIYFYRPAVMPNAIYSPDLYVNGEPKLSLKNGQISYLQLTPGEFTFEIEPDKQYSGLTQLTLNLNAGTTTFIRVDTTLKIKSSAIYEPYQRGFNLTKVGDKSAIAQITECCLNTENKKEEAAESQPEPETTTTDDGFSVNKTQNPFSH